MALTPRDAVMQKRLQDLSGAPHNFGKAACAWLDRGGEPETLIVPMQSVLRSPPDDQEDADCEKSRRTKLGEHLCNVGFIQLLNHPRVQENAALCKMLRHLAGKVISGSKERVPFPLCVLTTIQGKEVGVFWRPLGCSVSYAVVKRGEISVLKDVEIVGYPGDVVARMAKRLFMRQSRIMTRHARPQVRAICNPAFYAAKTIGREFGFGLTTPQNRPETVHLEAFRQPSLP